MCSQKTNKQNIALYEWLPAYLGDRTLPPYPGKNQIKSKKRVCATTLTKLKHSVLITLTHTHNLNMRPLLMLHFDLFVQDIKNLSIQLSPLSLRLPL